MEGLRRVAGFTAHKCGRTPLPAPSDLVLLDMTMPRMNGKDTLIALRKRRADLPIVVSSGHGEAHALAQFEGHVLSGFVSKPYQIRTLRETIREALEV